MTDVLVRDRILGAGRPHGPDSLVNLYAAMPSLHVAWAAWCAAALVAATRGRWRHLAWLYPAATTVVVLATANHFLADAAAGLAVTALGLLAARATTRPDAAGPGPGGAGPAAAPPALGPGAATRRRRPVIGWRRLARRWGWAVTGAAAVLIALRAPAVAADVRAALAHGLRLPWLGAAAAAEAVCVAGLVMAQRQLLAAAGARLPARAVAAAVFASTGLARLLPAGTGRRGRLAGRAVPPPGPRQRHRRGVGGAGRRGGLHGRGPGRARRRRHRRRPLVAACSAAPRRSPWSPPRPWPHARPARRPGGWPVTLAGHGGAGGWPPAWPGWPATGSGPAGPPPCWRPAG